MSKGLSLLDAVAVVVIMGSTAAVVTHSLIIGCIFLILLIFVIKIGPRKDEGSI
jgi:hypothetical protein